MAELDSSLLLLRKIQRRATLRAFLHDYASWSAKILAGLLLAAALSPQLYWAVAAASVLAIAGLVASGLAARRKRPTAYQAAQIADGAAGLKDRLSTAVYFSEGTEPSALILRQRGDAIEHASRLDAAKLFPVRAPRAARYALALLLAVAALFAYRLQFSPPLLALLKRASETRLVRAIVNPIVQAMNRNENGRNESARAGEKQSSDKQSAGESQSRGTESAGKRGDVRRAAGESAQAEAQAAKQEQQQQERAAGGQGEQQETQDGREQQQGQQQGNQSRQGNGKQQQAANSKAGQGGERQQSGRDSEGAAGRNQSLAQSLMQAVKNLFSRPNASQSAPAQGQMGQNQGQQAQNGAQSQAGNQGQQGQGNQSASQQSQQTAQGQQSQQNQKNGTGIGTEPGAQQAGAANDFLGANARPDTVDVPIQQFTGEAQVRARTGDGVVTTPARNAAAPAVSSPAGAEQENIPLRYRAYLQRYFDHAKTGRK